MKRRRQIAMYAAGRLADMDNPLLPQPRNEPRPGNQYELVEDYAYEWSAEGYPDQRITIRAGFRYDGASVPRLAWTVSGILPDGLIRAAALIHDYLYSRKGILRTDAFEVRYEGIDWLPMQWRFSRQQCDRLFSRIMREGGVGKKQRRTAYVAVRLLGWVSWIRRRAS